MSISSPPFPPTYRYLNSFYFGMFGSCEVGMLVLKAINLNYAPHQMQRDALILVAILIFETIRVYLGRKSSLSEHGNWIYFLFIIHKVWTTTIWCFYIWFEIKKKIYGGTDVFNALHVLVQLTSDIHVKSIPNIFEYYIVITTTTNNKIFFFRFLLFFILKYKNKIGWHVILSVILTIPCAMGTYYLLWLQQKVLKLELILCALMLALQITELVYAIIFMFQSCRPTIYT